MLSGLESVSTLLDSNLDTPTKGDKEVDCGLMIPPQIHNSVIIEVVICFKLAELSQT